MYIHLHLNVKCIIIIIIITYTYAQKATITLFSIYTIYTVYVITRFLFFFKGPQSCFFVSVPIGWFTPYLSLFFHLNFKFVCLPTHF